MKGYKISFTALMIVVILMGGWPKSSIGAEPGSAEPHTGSEPAIALQAMSGATIIFRTQNGRAVDGMPPETRDVLHLVLRRNGTLTEPAERTLVVELTGIEVPVPGVTVVLRVETQHGDPDLESESPPRIQVWRESRWVPNTTGVTQSDVTVELRHEFTEAITSDGRSSTTPTDYMRYELLVTDGRQPSAKPLYSFGQDHALLLENQWIVPLPEVRETLPGAAPDELIIYYCDMIPFRKDVREPATWLPRERVSDYLQNELIPAMVEAYRTQSDDWGFRWHPEWKGHRPGQDADRLSVALTDSETWFHGSAPGRGHSGISLNVSRGVVEYETLTDGLLSTFHHELFHHHQINIHQHLGGRGQLGGPDGAWQFITEGMAVLASSVGQPEVEFKQTWGSRAYALHARGFVGWEGISEGDLNKSYERIIGYHGAAYWRFLYEQCGGMSNGVENPAAGMAVIRQVLMTLYSGDFADVVASDGFVQAMPAIMDEALGNSPCPFETYKQSLLEYARAIYALRLDGGRCLEPGIPADCGFYDPYSLYHNPPADTITYQDEKIVYSAAEQPYPAGIPSSFGVDFVEVELETTRDYPLTIEVRGAPGAAATFEVQLWQLMDNSVEAQTVSPATVKQMGTDGATSYIIAGINTKQHDRLGVIITRVDTREDLDTNGAYTIVLHPGS